VGADPDRVGRFLEPVIAPEQFLVHRNRWHSSDAARQCLVGLFLSRSLISDRSMPSPTRARFIPARSAASSTASVSAKCWPRTNIVLNSSREIARSCC
jgi:hypothetical protein